MEILKMKISEMNRAAYNPRVELKAGDEEYETIRRSIESFGLVQPIVLNRRTNTVVSGHQRLTVLEDMGAETAEVSIVDLDEIQEKQLNIAMNKVTGDWDDRKLAEVLAELEDEASEVGFSDAEVDALLNQLETVFGDDTDALLDEAIDELEPDHLVTLTFNKSEYEDVNAYIKKNDDSAIINAIVEYVKGENEM